MHENPSIPSANCSSERFRMRGCMSHLHIGHLCTLSTQDLQRDHKAMSVVLVTHSLVHWGRGGHILLANGVSGGALIHRRNHDVHAD
jgi:hypothetical protein